MWAVKMNMLAWVTYSWCWFPAKELLKASISLQPKGCMIGATNLPDPFVQPLCAACRMSGGDKVEALLTAAHDEVVVASVTDLGNGSYSAGFTVKRPGTWTLRPRVRVHLPSSVPLVAYLWQCLMLGWWGLCA